VTSLRSGHTVGLTEPQETLNSRGDHKGYISCGTHTVTMATYSETCRSSHSLVLTTAMNYFSSEKRLGLHTLLW